eukprot:4486884-Prymnesium_polylepis.1
MAVVASDCPLRAFHRELHTRGFLYSSTWCTTGSLAAPLYLNGSGWWQSTCRRARAATIR